MADRRSWGWENGDRVPVDPAGWRTDEEYQAVWHDGALSPALLDALGKLETLGRGLVRQHRTGRLPAAWGHLLAPSPAWRRPERAAWADTWYRSLPADLQTALATLKTPIPWLLAAETEADRARAIATAKRLCRALGGRAVLVLTARARDAGHVWYHASLVVPRPDRAQTKGLRRYLDWHPVAVDGAAVLSLAHDLREWYPLAFNSLDDIRALRRILGCLAARLERLTRKWERSFRDARQSA